jgi:hypothetical protein
MKLNNTLFSLKERLSLLKWSAEFFTIAAIVFVIAGLRYFFVYHFPSEPLGLAYTIAAFSSHFLSIGILLFAGITLPLVLLLPFRKLIISISVIAAAVVISLILLDSQIYTAHRFHFTILTIKILGWKTWGFGIFYFLIFTALFSLIARNSWKRSIIDKKGMRSIIVAPVTIVLLGFTHVTHMWADATGYMPVTRFTTTLPLFYPSTSKRFMIKHGFNDIANRRSLPKNFSPESSGFYYPQKPLHYDSLFANKNILIICIDALRADVVSDSLMPGVMSLAKEHGTIFTNHWSGGNSTKMGLFSLFYGIPPTYQQYVENNKVSPVLVNTMLDKNYAMGIFTSYKLYAPASLDITAFVKIANLRLETKVDGSQDVYRKDSALTTEWKQWLDTIQPRKNFFGFLFYDVLSVEGYPPHYKSRVKITSSMNDMQKRFEHYKVGVEYLDSLTTAVIDDLQKRDLLKNTIVIITSDHGEEYNENGLNFTGHGSAFSKIQMKTPMIIFSPGHGPSTVTKRTSHYDIVPTFMQHGLGCTSPVKDFSSGNDLFSNETWQWLIGGSYYNFAIIEPDKITIQFPGGYYETRDTSYQLINSTSLSPYLTDALAEMGRFYRR